MILGVAWWVVVVVAVALIAGATAQGLVGLGLGQVAAPVTALVEPHLMPELLLFLAVTMPLVTLTRDHHDIDWPGLRWSLPSRVGGTIVGVLIVGTFTHREIGFAVGAMVLISVLLTIRAVRIPILPSTLVGAGFVSGVTGTATSIGGPPIALLYQHRLPHQIRSTLAVYFCFGACFSLIGLAVAGQVRLETFLLALLLMPCLLIGFGISRPLHHVVPRAHLRSGVLMICGMSAVALLVKSALI